MPLLRYRSMAHGLSARKYHAGERGGYGNRYAPWLHFDVMDQMNENGASAMPSLADVQDLLGGLLPASPVSGRPYKRLVINEHFAGAK